MKIVVYVRLMDEGVEVYRPVEATEIRPGVAMLHDESFVDHSDEVWEFEPGSVVKMESRPLEGEDVWIAVSRLT